MQEEIKKRKRKALLFLDYNCLERTDIIRTIAEMRQELKNIFRNHIGEEESISPIVLFENIFSINPMYLDIFKKNYWWSILKNVMRAMRSSEELFIVNKGGKLFVLKTQLEADKYKFRLDRDIEHLSNLKVKADRWVRKKRWRNF